MKLPSSNLLHVLLGKSIAETLLVATIAVVTFLNVLPPHFRGWGEVSETEIAGWAVNLREPGARVEVQLFIDGKFVSSAIADKPRADVKAAGWSEDEWHGYVFRVIGQPVGQHSASVYALHESGDGIRKSLQLLGDPIKFEVTAEGKLKPAPAQ